MFRKSTSAPEKCDFVECLRDDPSNVLGRKRILNARIRAAVKMCVSLVRYVSDAGHMCNFADNKSTDKFCLTKYGSATKRDRKGELWSGESCEGELWSGESCEGELIMNVRATVWVDTCMLKAKCLRLELNNRKRT